jgi:hypothetical protein
MSPFTDFGRSFAIGAVKSRNFPEGFEHAQARLQSTGFGERHRKVQLYYRCWLRSQQSVVEQDDLRPIGRFRLRMQGDNSNDSSIARAILYYLRTGVIRRVCRDTAAAAGAALNIRANHRRGLLGSRRLDVESDDPRHQGLGPLRRQRRIVSIAPLDTWHRESGLTARSNT